MPAKRIHTDRLDGVRYSYMDMSEVLAASADFIGAGDASREKLAATTTKVQDVSRHIADVVDAMDSYLNSVAAGFLVSNPVGWGIGIGIGVGIVSGLAFEAAYESNYLNLQDGLDRLGECIDDLGHSLRNQFFNPDIPLW